MSDTVDKATAWDELAKKNVEIGRLRDAALNAIEAIQVDNDDIAAVAYLKTALASRDEQSAPPEGDNDPNGNRDLAREIDG